MDYRLPDHPGVRVRVRDVGLACCAAEFAAAVGRGLLVPAGPDESADIPMADVPMADIHVLVISGTVTEALLPGIECDWADLPEPRVAVAFGACSTSGGPYWDSYAVVNGVDAVLPVTRYVPGCPPRPESLVAALAEAAGSAR